MAKKLHSLILIVCMLFFSQHLMAQYVTISGTVYDQTARNPLEAVAVISTSGKGTITDSTGKYSITVKRTDSLWFSLIGKTTMKYVVDTINNVLAFDVMIHVRAANLPEVKVRNSYYKYDSLQNRKDYAKIFNFKKPSIGLTSNTSTFNPGTVTVGLDLEQLINMFRFKRTRQLLAFQRRLIEQEQDKYIDHRFSRAFVKKILQIQGSALDTFMIRYRPEYDWLQNLNDLELGYYIQKCYEAYMNNKPAPFKGYKKDDEYEG